MVRSFSVWGQISVSPLSLDEGLSVVPSYGAPTLGSPSRPFVFLNSYSERGVLAADDCLGEVVRRVSAQSVTASV